MKTNQDSETVDLDRGLAFCKKQIERGASLLEPMVWQKGEGVDPFLIELNWDHVVDGTLIKWDLGRMEPLLFPDLVPPRTYSHFHGRYRYARDGKSIVWTEYPPTGLDRMFDLPPNLPMTDSHWIGRNFPGRREPFANAEEAAQLITAYRTALGMKQSDQVLYRGILI